MALQPIPLGPDVVLTQGNGPYADNNTFDSFSGEASGIIPMGNGVNILVFPILNPVTPFQSGTIARAFTVNGDGTQNWGNALQLGTDNTGADGVALDATRALIVYGGGAGILFQVLTLNGLNLSAGATSVLVLGGGFTSFNIGRQPLKVMSPTTVLFGYRGTRGTSSEAIRVQLLQVTGTSVLVDFSNALSLYDGAFLSNGAPVLSQVDKYTCAFFWYDGSNKSLFGTVQLNTTYDSMTDVGFGASQLYDGTTVAMYDFRELSFGFVLAVGARQPPPNQLVAQILEFNSAAHFLTLGPLVDLTQTVPVASMTGQARLLGIAGHQAVLLARRKPVDLLQHARLIELNLGTYAREIQEIGFVDFELITGLNIVDAPGPSVALNPRRMLMMYTPKGVVASERMITVGVPLVDPLRWRQRDDCLTPGSATPCICYNLTPNVVCIPPWWLRITSSVQFGGGVGPRNHAL